MLNKKTLPILDPRRDLALLAQGKPMSGQYRGHVVSLRPTSLYQRHSPSRPLIELIVESAQHSPLASLTPNSSAKTVMEHLAQVLSPAKLTQLYCQRSLTEFFETIV